MNVRGAPDARNEAGSAGIQTFLIADIRGYTRFTQDHGDEAATELAAKFAALARDGVGGHGGRIIELRGDEALAVFDSPRQALRAAVDLQDRFLEETETQPELPLGVGIGVDAGEAVAFEEGYRGGALNLAARLCGIAGPGEILASLEVIHFARGIPGINYVSRGKARLKGLPAGAQAVRVVPEAGDPAERFAALQADESRSTRARRQRIIAVVVAAAMITAVAAVILTNSGSGLARIEADSVGLIDLESGEIVDQVRVGERPGDVARGAGSIWVVNGGDETVSRIDPTTNAIVDTISVGEAPVGIAFGYGAVWVTNGADASVSRIDSETNEVVQTIEVDSGPAGITTGHEAVWVANKLEDTVTRLDANRGSPVATIDVGDGPSGVAVGPDAVWVTNQFSGTVSRIDPESNEVGEPINVGNGPRGIAVGDTGVWVANSVDGTASRIDPDANSVAETIPVGSGPSAVALNDDSVWVVNERDGTVSKIDAASNEVVDTISVGSAPGFAAVVGEALWVTAGVSEGSHRGGALVLASELRVFDIDPAIAYYPDFWRLLSVTNDGLVDFKRVGGSEGATLVPNLATSLPTPTNGGKTYTFELRDDIHYSTGEPLEPADVRHSIERVFKVRSPAVALGFYSGVLGASECTPRKCDLSEGIVTDDSTNTVTFNLDSPDPDFAYKLALPFAYVLPSETPDESTKEKPLPATGPYMIASYEPGHQIELVRNPQFREWSPAAQPTGYVDEIVWRLDVESGEQVTQVATGRADWMEGVLRPRRIEEISARYPDQVHFTVTLSTYYMTLNTRVPPFDDLKVRRALNYAVDREQIVVLWGGPEVGRPTCQVLPPTLPSYEPYCPYTSNPTPDGEWTAPDIDEARRLIAASGTKGMKVTVWVWDAPPVKDIGEYFVAVLDDLGYRANLKVDDISAHFEAISDSGSRAQVAFAGFFADYPAPSNFIEPHFTCDAFLRNDLGNQNYQGFCDQRIDFLIAEAGDLQVSDPAAARELWARIDAAIVDHAPWVPLLNQRSVEFLSARVGNYQYHPIWGVLIDQVWVR
jgi:peptide/nickel transport system substrate-binding protein